MTAVAVTQPSLRERAERAWYEAAERREREAAEAAEREKESRVTRLVERVKAILNLEIEASQVRWDEVVSPHATVVIDGLTFSVIRHFDRWELSVRRECSRGCNRALWECIHYGGLVSLHEALTAERTHDDDCLIIYDEEGEAITDRSGRPLPLNPPAPKPPTMAERLADVVREIVRDELASQGDDI